GASFQSACAGGVPPSLVCVHGRERRDRGFARAWLSSRGRRARATRQRCAGMKSMKSIGAMLTGKAEVDSDAIRKLSALLDETGLSEIEIEQSGARIRAGRRLNGNGAMMETRVAQTPEPMVAASVEPVAKGPPAGAVTSPMVGTVYVAPEPGAQPFVKVGQ